MADVPEFLIFQEEGVGVLDNNVDSQKAYYESHEGWPITDVAAEDTARVLARDGRAPTEPTRKYTRRRATRAEKRKREAEEAGGGDADAGVA